MAEATNSEEEDRATNDAGGAQENRDAPDSSKQFAGLASAGSNFNDGAGALTTGTVESGAAVAIAAAEGAEHEISRTEPVKIKTQPEEIPSSGGAAGGSAIAALGIYNAAKEFGEEKQKDNVAGQIVSGADMTVGVTNLGINIAAFTGKAVPGMLESGARIGGTAVLVAGSTMKVLNAKPEDRAAVATGEVVKDGVGLGVATVSQGLATGLGLTGASAAVTPVVLAAGAVYIADKGVEKVMDDRKSYQTWEKNVEAESKPVKEATASAGQQPVPGDYRHLLVAMRESAGNINYDRIQGPTVKQGPVTIHLGADGRPDFTDAQIAAVNRLNQSLEKQQIVSNGFQHKSTQDGSFLLKVDLKNPQNLKEMGNAIDTEIAKQKKIMGENESAVPAYLRTSAGALKDLTTTGGRSAHLYMDAKEKLAWLQSGRSELTQYENDLQAWNNSKKSPAVSSSPAPLQQPVTLASTLALAQNTASPRPPAQPQDHDVVASGGIKAPGGDVQGDFEAAAKGETHAPSPAPAAVLTADDTRPVRQNKSPSV